MPRCLDTRATFTRSLKGDDAAKFHFRYLNASKWAALHAKYREQVGKPWTECGPMVFEILRSVLRGWDGLATDDLDVLAEFGLLAPGPGKTDPPIPLPYRPDLLEHVLSRDEADDLLVLMMAGQQPTEEERKN